MLYAIKSLIFQRNLTITPINEIAKKAGIKEIARRANVSIGTVDRAIHNREGVSRETKEKILQIIKELNYQPNILARRLASKRVYRFGVLIPEAAGDDSSWRAQLKGVEQAESEISQFGVELYKQFFLKESKESFYEKAALLMAAQLDGLLIAPLFETYHHPLLSHCEASNTPYVLLGTDLPDSEKLSFIGTDCFKSGYLAGRLVSYGLPKDSTVLIIDLSEPGETESALKREKGFMAHFQQKANQGQTKFVKVTAAANQEAVYSALKEAMKSENVQGIFVLNSRADLVASYLKDNNLCNIRLIGFDLLEKNIEYLNEEVIDFLISLKPEEQGYLGVMTLYKKLLLQSEVIRQNYIPLDIITKENINCMKF